MIAAVHDTLCTLTTALRFGQVVDIPTPVFSTRKGLPRQVAHTKTSADLPAERCKSVFVNCCTPSQIKVKTKAGRRGGRAKGVTPSRALTPCLLGSDSTRHIVSPHSLLIVAIISRPPGRKKFVLAATPPLLLFSQN